MDLEDIIGQNEFANSAHSRIDVPLVRSQLRSGRWFHGDSPNAGKDIRLVRLLFRRDEGDARSDQLIERLPTVGGRGGD